MKCRKCGAEYDENDKFCRECGASLCSNKSYAMADNTEQSETAVATPTYPPEIILKGKILKFALKAIFAVFIVLTFIFYLLPVNFMTNVYSCVGQGNYTNGLDGRWEDEYFIANLLINIFSDIDLVRTPCAVMLLISFFGALFIIAWTIVSIVKYKHDGHLKAMLAPELAFFAIYLIYVITSGIAIFGQSQYYEFERSAALTALLVLSLVCLTLSVAVLIVRRLFFNNHKPLVAAMHVI